MSVVAHRRRSRRVRRRSSLDREPGGKQNQVSILLPKRLAEYLSTTLLFWIKGSPPVRRLGDSRLGIMNRLSVRCSRGSDRLQHTSPLQPLNEIFYRFSQPLHFSRFNTLALDGIRPNGARGALPGAARKIRDAAGPVDLPARDFAANDLAVRPVHQLSGERRRARE